MTWSSPESPGEPDEVGFGSARPPRVRWPGSRWPRRSGWARWPLILAGAAVIAVAAVLTLGRHPVKLAAAQSQVTVTEAGHRLLGVRAGWELLGYGPNRAVRVQLARGRVTQTVVPALGSTGPVSFVAGPSQMIIRPWDVVPGYLVPDGKPARPLPGVLGQGGEVLPGPRPGEVWVQDPPRSLALVRLDGSRTGVSIRLPAGEWWLASPNGRGDVLLSGVGEIFDVWPGGSRRRRDARGGRPDPLADRELRPPAPCADVVIDPATGAQRQLGGRRSRRSGCVPRRHRAGRRHGRDVPGHGRRPGHAAPGQPGHRGGSADRGPAQPERGGPRDAGLVPGQPVAVRDHRARRPGRGERRHPAGRGPRRPAPLAQPDRRPGPADFTPG